MQAEGAPCRCCSDQANKGRQDEVGRLVEVRGALVCAECDALRDWPISNGPG